MTRDVGPARTGWTAEALQRGAAAVRRPRRARLQRPHGSARSPRPAEVMAVVKADAYGHGLVPCARAARLAGASWLGTALRRARRWRCAPPGSTGRSSRWLSTPGGTASAAIEHDVDVSVGSVWALAEVAAAAPGAGPHGSRRTSRPTPA